jgi:ferrochelatase
MKQGILLINLGTPQSASPAAIRKYLAAFLTDKRVITLPKLLRYLLVYCIILPTRQYKTAKAYQAIWTKQGSPLLVHSQALAKALQKAAPAGTIVSLGMRYGEPSLAASLDDLKACDLITILPLYPQYTSAATGSALEAVLQLIAKQANIPAVHLIRDFYQHPAYIKAQAACIKKHLHNTEHLLFSYHGIPENQLTQGGSCYKTQCQQNSRLLAEALGLKPEQYSTTFQSRLGKTAWVQPYTDVVLCELANQGIKDISITCPSFVCDCLETLEEIAIVAKKQWQDLKGGSFTYIPCMNSDPEWIQALLAITTPRSS